MKKYFGFLLILSLSYFNAFSQTNVYPADGNVGLGITTPTSKLSVRGDIDLTTTNKFGFNLIDKFTYNTMIQPHYGLQWLSDPDYVGGASFWLSSYGGMKFFAGSLPRLVITNVGNIGIGINNPKGKLTVNGDVAVASALGNSDSRPVVGAGSIAGEIRGMRNDGSAGWDDGFLRISAGGGTNANSKSFIDLSGYAAGAAVERNKNIIMGTAGQERFRISADGNVGIGTSNPIYKLDVVGLSRFTNRLLINNAVDDASSSVIVNGAYSKFISEQNTNILLESMGVGGRQFRLVSTDNTASIGGGKFSIFDNNSGQHRFVLDLNGNVGIGINDTKGYKLAVAGNMIAEQVTVKLKGNWPDYVFTPSYNLPSLQETEQHIKEKGHLPGIPSAEEVKSNGVDLGEMNAKLLQKIEELTLHLIEMQKDINQLKKENQALKQTNSSNK